MVNGKKLSPFVASERLFEQSRESNTPIPGRVVYEKKRHGPVKNFLKTDEGKELQTQFSNGIEEIETFLRNKSPHSIPDRLRPGQKQRFEKNAEQLNLFRDRIKQGNSDGSYYSTLFDEVAGTGKHDFDRIVNKIKDPNVDSQLIYDEIARIPADVNVCAPGTITNLNEIAEHLEAMTGGIQSFIHQAYNERAKDVIADFARKTHQYEEGYESNEIHYVNGYRNRLAEQFYLKETVDPFVSKTVDNADNVNRCEALLRTSMSMPNFVDHLSDRYVDTWKNAFPSKTIFTADDFKTEQFEALNKTLDSQFGSVKLNDLLQDHEDGTYSLRKDRTLVTRAIAHNLRDLKILESFKSTTIAGDKQSGYVVKVLGDLVYRKEYLKGQRLERRPLNARDLSEKWLTKKDASSAPISSEYATVNEKPLSSSDVLHAAVTNGNKDVVHMLINAGADLNAKNGNDETVLHSLAKGGHVEILEVLSKAGVDISDALHVAAEHGSEKMFLAALDAGVDINSKTQNGEAIVYSAARGGNANILKFLSNSGVDTSSASEVAARYKSLKAARAAIKAGADVNSIDQHGETMLYAAARTGHTEMVNMLLEAGADGQTGNADTPLSVATYYGHLNIVKALLKHDKAGIIKTGKGYNPLQVAASRGHAEIMEALLEAGVCNASLGRENALIMGMDKAVGNGNIDTVRVLMKAGAKINNRTPSGDTMLKIAVKAGQLDMLKELCSDPTKINVDQTDNAGGTALHAAVLTGRKDLVRVLIKAGITRNIKNNDDQTALKLALENGYKDVATEIRKARWNTFKALFNQV
jgi:ankyrin repeat protein